MNANYLLARSYYFLLSQSIYPAKSRFAKAAMDFQTILQLLAVKNPVLFCLACFSKWFLFLVTGLKVSNISRKSNSVKGKIWKEENKE